MSTSSFNRLSPPPAPMNGGEVPGTYVKTFARDAFGRNIPEQYPQTSYDPYTNMHGNNKDQPVSKKKEAATDALGRRAASLADELDFPAFVASLVHGTFDAIVDSSIRQMEAYAELVSAVAKPLDQFAKENVTNNQARDWTVEQFPADVVLTDNGGELVLSPANQDEDEFAEAPSWLDDFGYQDEPLTSEFLEEKILPIARERVAQQRLSSLATMVLLGMQRVVIKDGTIAARLRFRAAAADHSAIQYATSNDPGTGGTEWGRRGSGRAAVTKVSTVDVNVQSESELKAQMFGDVKINFASETVPLDRFVDEAQRTLLERNSRRIQGRQDLPVQEPIQPQSPSPVQQTQQPTSQIPSPVQPQQPVNNQGGTR